MLFYRTCTTKLQNYMIWQMISAFFLTQRWFLFNPGLFTLDDRLSG